MFNFSCFGFPVEVRWQFWLTAAILGGGIGAESGEALFELLIWMAVVFVSILLHELGHGFAMRHFGDRQVRIVLHSFGGFAQGSRRLSRSQDVLMSAAGPATSLFVGFVGYLVIEAMPMLPDYLLLAFAFLMRMNLLWAVVNLLPIIPLDGGRISLGLFGPGRERSALKLGFYVAIGAALYLGLMWHSLWNGVFFAMLAYNNWQQMNNRGQVNWLG